MRFTITCTQCQAEFVTDTCFAGLKRPCPQCGFKTLVEAPPAGSRGADGDKAAAAPVLDRARLGCTNCLRLFVARNVKEMATCSYCATRTDVQEGLKLAEILESLEERLWPLLLSYNTAAEIIAALSSLGLTPRMAEKIYLTYKKEIPFKRVQAYKDALQQRIPLPAALVKECDRCGGTTGLGAFLSEWDQMEDEKTVGGPILGNMLPVKIVEITKFLLAGLHILCEGCARQQNPAQFNEGYPGTYGFQLRGFTRLRVS